MKKIGISIKRLFGIAIDVEDKIYSFTENGFLHIDSAKLRQTEGYKHSREQARILSKNLNLPNYF